MYTIVENASQRVDENWSAKKATSTFWTCSVRGRTMMCRASVTQKGEDFTPGDAEHVHPSDPGLLLKVKLAASTRTIAETSDIFRPAMDIVKDSMTAHVEPDDFCLPKPSLLKRAVNSNRQNCAPRSHPILNLRGKQGIMWRY
ncbi:hypothetical protein ScPMuIL_011172 [Solemya velum]